MWEPISVVLINFFPPNLKVDNILVLYFCFFYFNFIFFHFLIANFLYIQMRNYAFFIDLPDELGPLT